MPGQMPQAGEVSKSRPSTLGNQSPQRLGFDRDEALSLGKAVAGLNAQDADWENSNPAR